MSVEALVSIAAMLALVLLFVRLETSLAEKEREGGAMLFERAELERAALQLGYFGLDGRNSHVDMRLRNITVAGKREIGRGAGGKVAAARTLAEVGVKGGVLGVEEQELEPV